MSEFGLKIRNIKAATLYSYNKGLRGCYDYTEAMFCNSLFSKFIRKHGMTDYKDESTRDIICLDFSFGTRSFEEEMNHLQTLLNNELNKEELDGERINYINNLIEYADKHRYDYEKLTKDEIRNIFYKEGCDVTYFNMKDETYETIHYKMLYRNPSKAKTGQVMFINEKLYDIAYEWLTMGIGKKMQYDNAKIVEISAYAPLTTSTIVGELRIPVKDILIVEDQDSLFKTMANVVRSEDYECKVNGEMRTLKKCVVNLEEVNVKNTIWDGMALIEECECPDWINGMCLLRQHFFKACAFKTRIQLFFQDWCEKNGYDYETYFITDMFGMKHKLKDIKVITTNNAIKWLKFKDIMGETPKDAYKYWRKIVNADGSIFGIVKTDHPSKLGNVQQMSYQMINTLPSTQRDITDLVKTSVDYVNELKNNNDVFVDFLKKNANVINNYEMLADLYEHYPTIADSDWFRTEKSDILKTYINKLRNGKITVDADNLTACGNPYALLLYVVGEDWQNDPTLKQEDGTIQCYTKRFCHDEYLCCIRSPHNSPNNFSYLHNQHSKEMDKYFAFSKNIIAFNCMHTDMQDRMNGEDFDSDFNFVSNHPTLVECAKECYMHYHTVVNALAESGITYKNNMSEYAKMDANASKAQLDIGESSNLAMLAISYYWTELEKPIPDMNKLKELSDNFNILAVLAQVAIDSIKREYEVSVRDEINRIKKMECMNITKENSKGKIVKCDYPYFMKYVKEVPTTKNGKELSNTQISMSRNKILNRINKEINCPMNWLEFEFDKLFIMPKNKKIDISNYIVNLCTDVKKVNTYQVNKIREMAINYSAKLTKLNSLEDDYELMIEETNQIIEQVSKIKMGKQTLNYIIAAALNVNTQNKRNKYRDFIKYRRKLLTILYRVNRTNFLKNFQNWG